ncbi:MAG TPA: hypothetical protein VF463_14990 [Sphingobium sp.]
MKRAVLIVILLAACKPTPSLKEQYAGHWYEPTAEVAATLLQNHVQGCGEFYQKVSSYSQGEFAVACTRDGANWDGYLVWPRIGKIIGPDLTMVWNIGGPPYAPTKDGKPGKFNRR